jgi:hypothetical protein
MDLLELVLEVTVGRFEDHEYLNMRYQGTETSIMVLKPADGDFKNEFKKIHLREQLFSKLFSLPVFSLTCTYAPDTHIVDIDCLFVGKEAYEKRA